MKDGVHLPKFMFETGWEGCLNEDENCPKLGKDGNKFKLEALLSPLLAWPLFPKLFQLKIDWSNWQWTRSQHNATRKIERNITVDCSFISAVFASDFTNNKIRTNSWNTLKLPPIVFFLYSDGTVLASYCVIIWKQQEIPRVWPMCFAVLYLKETTVYGWRKAAKSVSTFWGKEFDAKNRLKLEQTREKKVTYR